MFGAIFGVPVLNLPCGARPACHALASNAASGLRPAGFVQTPQRLVIGYKDAGAEVTHERHLGELVAFFRGTHLKDHAFLHQEMGSGVAIRLLQNVVIKSLIGFPTR
jgi:hypothetical protein